MNAPAAPAHAPADWQHTPAPSRLARVDLFVNSALLLAYTLMAVRGLGGLLWLLPLLWQVYLYDWRRSACQTPLHVRLAGGAVHITRRRFWGGRRQQTWPLAAFAAVFSHQGRNGLAFTGPLQTCLLPRHGHGLHDLRDPVLIDQQDGFALAFGQPWHQQIRDQPAAARLRAAFAQASGLPDRGFTGAPVQGALPPAH